MSLRLLFFLALPSVVDSIYRAQLFARSHRGLPKHSFEPVARWMVLIPSRSEGAGLRPTLESTRAALTPDDGEIVVLLDGDDAEGEEIAVGLGCVSLVKRPAGPSKAAALRWFAHHHRDRLRLCDAVLLLDVGSRLPVDFFERFRWPAHADAVQAFLRGSGTGAGDAAALSENLAQSREDVGRESLGWSVRLRGTGMAVLPSVFERLFLRVVTQVEDMEASLLVIADGFVSRMTPENCYVLDEKPLSVTSAAVQRARWLVGKLQIVRQSPAIVRALIRHPVEALGFAAEIFGRPLALSVPFRAVIAAMLIVSGIQRSDRVAQILGAIVIVSAISDSALVLVHSSLTSSIRLITAWLGAVLLAPRAFLRWMRARRP